jgi:hypothetical protein
MGVIKSQDSLNDRLCEYCQYITSRGRQTSNEGRRFGGGGPNCKKKNIYYIPMHKYGLKTRKIFIKWNVSGVFFLISPR